MRRTVIALAVLTAVVAGCAGGPAPEASRPPTPPPSSPSSPSETASAPAPVRSWDGLRGRLEALDADVGMLAARVGADGACTPVADLDPGTPRPMASVFKLYVLGAVAAAADAGELGWDDELTVSGSLRSLPSGELQDLPDGSRVPVSLAAAKMISVSDNTAADLLIDRVGRRSVEEAMTALGHGRPGLNQPFLTTREFFTVGWGAAGLRDDWARAGAAARLRILTALPGGPLRVSGRDIDDPAWESGVDWFGSAADVCAALATLHGSGWSTGTTEVLRSVLGHNRGVTIDRETWPYVAFKGGSAPGEVTAAWYGERVDGERYAFVMQAASPDAAALADRESFFRLGEDAFALFSHSPRGTRHRGGPRR
ncbi:serine hydrolase [Jiangella ureilytica]|uniref:Serine hydrolase n=1 Tax=Jiangella ureilytica TaxID=2530374 RepID=A0A4R4RCX0_9ACTN|nr:serine hydrolase [Jiangella ureilytica]TDC46213.1 serine hydrolase [Jiangella ureilytica]